MGDKILFVDDEPLVLESLSRALRGRYHLSVATSGAAGLDLITDSLTQNEPFAVVVSDMRMPGMDGVEFLARVSLVLPDAITMILSGQADLEQTIKVVNSANLFRFLTKPCSAESLRRNLDHGLRQYELVRAERELLERTLGGAVTVLTQVLSMASPAASRRTAQMRAMTASVTEQLGLQSDWRLPIAAMLSHIGCIAVPGPVLEKLETTGHLDSHERAMFDAHPAQGRQLLAQIPRLGDIAEWIGNLPTSYDPGTHRAPTPLATSSRPVDDGAQIIEAVGRFLVRHTAGDDTRTIIKDFTADERYPARLVEALLEAAAALQPFGTNREVTVKELATGMIFQEDVRTSSGQILIRRGERVTPPLATRLANFAATVGVAEPIKVLVAGDRSHPVR